MPLKNCALDVVLRLAATTFEQAERVVVLAVAVLVPAEEVVELPVEVALVRCRTLSISSLYFCRRALDDVGGLREVGRELREPEQRLVELGWFGLSRSREKMPYAAWKNFMR